ncbi:MAG: hypothetical protein II067_07175 [Agathobacter sp.]|uniref:DUF6465 family protein n=1 Tax=Agathobacter sp. TaxID=2021311 RepID=UPI00257C884E|nr:DUF6465 family protein [Agathobacter sp.]MBQ1681976.1 hypothetical protein [Agathobacter sp.]
MAKDVKATKTTVAKTNAVKKEEPILAAVVEEPAKKAPEKKAPAKKAPAKKAPAKKAVTAKETTSVIVQYQNNEVNVASVEEKVKAQFISEGHTAASIKKVAIYVKPEEYAAYYVINEKFSGRVDLF